jgi:hypothetical protein
LTYEGRENVAEALTQQINLIPDDILPTIQKFRNYTSPTLGEIRVHYGFATDPKHEYMTHGVGSNKKSHVNKTIYL